MAKKRKTFFQENWKLLIVLLLPLTLLLIGIVGLIIYDTSYAFRQSWDAWWRDLTAPGPEVAVTANPLAVVPQVPTFKEKHVTECGSMPNKYIIDNPGDDNPIDLNPSIGLLPDASGNDVEERCKAFAKIVYSMESLSKHRHHAYLCPGTRFSIGKDYGFIPDPKGKGVLLASDDPKAKTFLIDLPLGEQTVYQQWQFFNPGGGCYVVGYSSRRSRTMEIVPSGQ